MENLETPRLLLRPPREADAPAVRDIRNSAFVLQYNPMRPFSLEEMAADLRERRDRTRILEAKADGAVLGAVFWEEDPLRYRVDAFCLSYYLDEAHRRRGYMSEALSALIPALFQEGCEVLSARVFRENAGSAVLLEKLGFRREGCVRLGVRGLDGVPHDDLLFSLLREEAGPRPYEIEKAGDG